MCVACAVYNTVLYFMRSIFCGHVPLTTAVPRDRQPEIDSETHEESGKMGCCFSLFEHFLLEVRRPSSLRRLTRCYSGRFLVVSRSRTGAMGALNIVLPGTSNVRMGILISGGSVGMGGGA